MSAAIDTQHRIDPNGSKPFGLMTDLYELTMAQGYRAQGLAGMEACFTVFFRENPFGGGFGLVCGTAQIASLIEGFHYSEQDISYLAGLDAPGGGKLFTPEFLKWLADWRPRLTIEALPEGDLVFPREPMVRVTGPVVDCQLIEAPLLNLVNFQTLVATKAARMYLAADGRPLAEFGLRRAQGPDGSLSATRASYVGGFVATSNVLAGQRYGIPVTGTMAHSWVMSFPDELSAFRAYAADAPNNCTILVDTYDALGGVANAITVAREMEAAGHRLSGIRFDSGDLAVLSRKARAMLDEAGLPYVKIVLSNDLDEHLIESLLYQGAAADVFAVGTKLVTCYDQPALSGVYKICAKRMPGEAEWTPVMKLSEQVYKRTIPGCQDVRRFFDADGAPVADMICDPSYPLDATPTVVDVNDPMLTTQLGGLRCEAMLKPMVVDGLAAGKPESLAEVRERALRSLASLDPACKRLLNPQTYVVGLEKGLAELRQSMVVQAREHAASHSWR